MACSDKSCMRDKEFPPGFCLDCPEKPKERQLKSPYELFGVEHNKGWRHLVEPLFEMAKAEGATVLQVKEKFGTLRFYVSGASDELFEAIDKAERLSAETCEDCGQPGKIRQRGWIRTLCDACHEGKPPRFSEGRRGGLLG